MIDSISIKTPSGEEEPAEPLFHVLAAKPWLPFVLGIFFIALDRFSGAYIQFPVLFVISVALAAWFGGFRNAAVLAVGLPFCNLGIALLTGTEGSEIPVGMLFINAAIRASVLSTLAYFIARSSRQRVELERRVGLLRSEIPTCITCGKAEDEQKQWIPLPLYITRHTGAHFSNAICPACSKEKYGSA